MHLGMWEIVGILLVVLLLFGPSKLPGLGKSLGTAIRDFKKGLNSDESQDAAPQQKTAQQLPPAGTSSDVPAGTTAGVTPKSS
ncbi:MAG TPA: twin-arginine translocase TatA/TatE family subunit [Myxococcaceae bacterium]|nr:twin-arginine translocase TatA/TatE family subunit [Myxococcaceae bacterium]